MMSTDLDVCYNTVFELVKEAGEFIKEKIYLKKSVEVKSCDIDFVTEVDQQVEEHLINGLGAKFPDHKFIGEESVSSGSKCTLTDAPTWIIDPIDGTMNFVHGFPHNCISIALFVDSQPVIAIIYNPVIEQMFTARKGLGARLNDQVIKVSGITTLCDALLMIESGTSRDLEKMKVIHQNCQKLIPQAHGTRALGSAALDMAMVAMGAADAYFEFGIHIWDIAAGELIVTEAGGVVMDPSGGPVDRFSRRVLCASSKELAEQLIQNIVQYHPTPRD